MGEKKRSIPRALWIRSYRGRLHISEFKKHGFTKFVPQDYALALFIKKQLDSLKRLK